MAAAHRGCNMINTLSLQQSFTESHIRDEIKPHVSKFRLLLAKSMKWSMRDGKAAGLDVLIFAVTKDRWGKSDLKFVTVRKGCFNMDIKGFRCCDDYKFMTQMHARHCCRGESPAGMHIPRLAWLVRHGVKTSFQYSQISQITINGTVKARLDRN